MMGFFLNCEPQPKAGKQPVRRPGGARFHHYRDTAPNPRRRMCGTPSPNAVSAQELVNS